MKHKPFTRHFAPLILIAASLLLSACEVEFSPNAEWREIPVVYCVLDQDDDTTFVRVERCFLGEGNIYQYGSISDSINYPQGSIQVDLLSYRNGTIVDSIPFEFTLRDRDSGAFAHTLQPLYLAPTAGRLHEDCTYRLNIRHTSDRRLIATAVTNLVLQTDDQLITQPTVNKKFSFTDDREYCQITWNALSNARYYQPIIRFYYEQLGDTLHVDLPGPTKVAGGTAISYTVKYSRTSFLEGLKNYFVNDTVSRYYVPMVDIFLTACNEDLNAYIASSSGNTSIDNGREIYTNIQGGIGIFGARRTHLFKSLPADESDRPPNPPNSNNGGGLYWWLKHEGICLPR